MASGPHFISPLPLTNALPTEGSQHLNVSSATWPWQETGRRYSILLLSTACRRPTRRDDTGGNTKIEQKPTSAPCIASTSPRPSAFAAILAYATGRGERAKGSSCNGNPRHSCCNLYPPWPVSYIIRTSGNRYCARVTLLKATENLV